METKNTQRVETPVHAVVSTPLLLSPPGTADELITNLLKQTKGFHR